MMSTPDISDKYPDLPFLINFISYGGTNNFQGELVTVKCPNDNSIARELIYQNGNHKVLFIDGEDSKVVALLGDMLAEKALENNWAAVLINGMVRDVEKLRTIKLPIYARGSCPKKSNKQGLGQANAELVVQDILIKPSYWAYGDENGILISSAKLNV